MTGQVINTNVLSLNAQRNLSASQSTLATALQRLSSGLRINSAKDDAAGLAISERFTTQIRGLNQAARNANDGISLSQTAESALSELSASLQRIRELAVQSANSTNSASDRAALDQEVQQRLAEIDRIASQTSFNNLKVLDGSFGSATFQIGANVGETIAITLSTSMRTNDIGAIATAQSGDVSGLFADAIPGTDATAATYTTGALTALVGQDLSGAGTGGVFTTDDITVFDYQAGAAVTFDVDGQTITLNTDLTDLDGVEAEVQSQLDTAFGAGVYTVGQNALTLTITNDLSTTAPVIDNGTGTSEAEFTGGSGVAGTVGTVSFDVDGNTVTLDATYATLADLVTEVQSDLDGAAAGTYAVTASGTGIEIATVATGAAESAPVIDGFTGVGSVLLDGGTSVDGEDAVAEVPAVELTLAAGDFSIQLGTNTAVEVTGTFADIDELVAGINSQVAGVIATANDDDTFSLQSSQDITLAGDEADGDLGFADLESSASGDLSTANVTTIDDANQTLLRIDSALTEVNNLRSTFGAIQNRFESTISNLQAIAESLTASRSRILDADFAAETAELTRSQILQQAGIAILAQANAIPQNVLGLLQ